MSREEANNIRTEVLNEAIRVIGNRGTTHGAAGRNMQHIADLWSAYLGVQISVTDVPVMMVLAKVSRSKIGDPATLDHWTDIAGYAAIAAEVSQK